MKVLLIIQNFYITQCLISWIIVCPFENEVDQSAGDWKSVE